MAKYIFLDIDGVLCVPWKNPVTQNGMMHYLDPEACAEFARIVKNTGAKVVLSSAWRHGEKQIQQINEKFAELELPPLHSITPEMGLSCNLDRELEILTWLHTHDRRAENWIMLDDESWSLGCRSFKVRNRVGLTADIATAAIEFLNLTKDELCEKQRSINIPYHETGEIRGLWWNGRILPVRSDDTP